MSATAATPRRTWRIPRLPLEDWTVITLWGWVSLLVALVVIGLFIDNWSWIVGLGGGNVDDVSVTSSIWGPIAGIAIWYVGFVAGYYLHVYFPTFVASGRTRRDSAIEALIFGLWLAVGSTVLITVGFVYERVVYAIAGWQRGTPEDMLYRSYDDYGWILVGTGLSFMIWAAGGAMIGSGFYRGNGYGLFMIVVALLSLAISGSGNGGAGPFNSILSEIDLEPNRLTGVLLGLVAIGAMTAVTWWNVKEVPLRNK